MGTIAVPEGSERDLDLRTADIAIVSKGPSPEAEEPISKAAADQKESVSSTPSSSVTLLGRGETGRSQNPYILRFCAGWVAGASITACSDEY